MTPTARSLEILRSAGWLAEVVEKWNPHSRTRKDLWGWADILAIKDETTLAVQVTSASNHSARVKKIADSETIGAVRKAGWKVLVHSWRKNKQGRWLLREEDLS